MGHLCLLPYIICCDSDNWWFYCVGVYLITKTVTKAVKTNSLDLVYSTLQRFYYTLVFTLFSGQFTTVLAILTIWCPETWYETSNSGHQRTNVSVLRDQLLNTIDLIAENFTTYDERKMWNRRLRISQKHCCLKCKNGRKKNADGKQKKRKTAR